MKSPCWEQGFERIFGFVLMVKLFTFSVALLVFFSSVLQSLLFREYLLLSFSNCRYSQLSLDIFVDDCCLGTLQLFLSGALHAWIAPFLSLILILLHQLLLFLGGVWHIFHFLCSFYIPIILSCPRNDIWKLHRWIRFVNPFSILYSNKWISYVRTFWITDVFEFISAMLFCIM